MYRRRRFRTYAHIGRPVIGFYKDSKGRTRPITARTGRRRVRYVPPVRVPFYPERIQVGKQFLDATISHILNQAPIAKELHTACVLADNLYKNWSQITQLYNIYEQEGWQGIINVIRTDIIHDTLFSVQTDIAWATINPYIPKEFHGIAKHVVADVMDQVTSEEIKLVSHFLQSRGNQKLIDYKVRRGNVDAVESSSGQYQYRKRKRLPKEVKYV